MARKLKIMENEKQALLEVKYGEEHKKGGKWEMHTVGPGVLRKN